MLRDGSRLTIRREALLEEAQSRGLPGDTVVDLADAPLEDLDNLASTCFRANKALAAVEGGACGFGGPESTAADLPLLFGLSCRAIQQVGTCYGFDMDDPDTTPVVLNTLNVGAGASSSAKAAFLLDLHVVAEAFAKRWTYKKVATRTFTGTGTQLLKQTTRRLPKKIAHKVTKAKLAQSLPLVGVVVGAGFNYWFLQGVLQSARMGFRTLYLSRKYGGPDSGPPPVCAAT